NVGSFHKYPAAEPHSTRARYRGRRPRKWRRVHVGQAGADGFVRRGSRGSAPPRGVNVMRGSGRGTWPSGTAFAAPHVHPGVVIPPVVGKRDRHVRLFDAVDG